jgi:VIT1/CCC1 family predicted Fe2+/Mn2+ transporter
MQNALRITGTCVGVLTIHVCPQLCATATVVTTLALAVLVILTALYGSDKLSSRAFRMLSRIAKKPDTDK